MVAQEKTREEENHIEGIIAARCEIEDEMERLASKIERKSGGETMRPYLEGKLRLYRAAFAAVQGLNEDHGVFEKPFTNARSGMGLPKR